MHVHLGNKHCVAFAIDQKRGNVGDSCFVSEITFKADVQGSKQSKEIGMFNCLRAPKNKDLW